MKEVFYCIRNHLLALRYNRQVGAQIVKANLADVDTIDDDFALCRLDHAEEGECQRRFAFNR